MAGYLQDGDAAVRRKAVTVPSLLAMRASGEKIAMLTCYDASFATLMDECGVDVLLVGDSLGNVCQGQSSTLPVTLADVAYHTASVARGNRTAFLIADMPFGTYATPETAFANAVKLMQAGAQMVKLEGGARMAETIQYLSQRGIPVMAHIGLTPQMVHVKGGFRTVGRTQEEWPALLADAKAVSDAGAFAVVLEGMAEPLAARITAEIPIPTIGIGASPACDGQILVMEDMLGLNPNPPKFVRQYAQLGPAIEAAVRSYAEDVRARRFPGAENVYPMKKAGSSGQT